MLKNLRYFLLVFGLLCALFFAYQHLLFFQPKALDANHIFTFPARMKFSTATISFDESTRIDVVKFKQDDTTLPAKGVVLFFHGNRYNVEHYSPYAAYFTRHGYQVWMPDYPGYGRSTGEMDAGVLEQLSIQLYKMARVQFNPDNIVLYGKSMGTGVASYLAAERDCRHLILETPYFSLSSLTQTYAWFLPVPLLIRFNLQTGEYFKEITAPITIISAGDDELIPLQNTLRLLPNMKKNDAFYIVKDARHNGLPEFEAYNRVVDSVMRR